MSLRGKGGHPGADAPSNANPDAQLCSRRASSALATKSRSTDAPLIIGATISLSLAWLAASERACRLIAGLPLAWLRRRERDSW